MVIFHSYVKLSVGKSDDVPWFFVDVYQRGPPPFTRSLGLALKMGGRSRPIFLVTADDFSAPRPTP